MELYNRYGSFKKDSGYMFRVYVPDVDSVKLKIDDNIYDMTNNDSDWEITIDDTKNYTHYSYIIEKDGVSHEKADPFAKYSKSTSSWLKSYTYNDNYKFKSTNRYNKKTPNMKIQEFFLDNIEGNTYVEKANTIVNKYMKNTNYTHVQIMPMFHHYGNVTLGYLPSAYFSPYSKYGKPKEFKKFVDILHQNNIGVIIDFPIFEFEAFPKNGTLHNFNFNYMYNKSKGDRHPIFKGYYFDITKPWVEKFILSSLRYYINEFNIDGYRIDGLNEVIFEYKNNTAVKPLELEAVKRVLSRLDDCIIILENITTLTNAELQLPNVDFIENSMWMYDFSALVTIRPVDRLKFNINKMYQEKKKVYHEGYMLAGLPHDMFLDGYGRHKFGNTPSLQDYFVLLKILYSTPFPKLVYFDKFHDIPKEIEDDFNNYVKFIDSLNLSEYEFDLYYDRGLLLYFYKKDNMELIFEFNVLSEPLPLNLSEGDVIIGTDSIYPDKISARSTVIIERIKNKE
jgi:1,4-alpha-glucan branching enzyme